MARYGKDHKRLARERIIEAAGRRFKSDGIDGSGVATLMKDAGLTNGAFYGHFDSKEDLVSTALGEELRSQRAILGGLEPGRAGLEQFIRVYLSVEHRDDVGGGCPSAALLDEIGAAPTAPESHTATASSPSSTTLPVGSKGLLPVMPGSRSSACSRRWSAPCNSRVR